MSNLVRNDLKGIYKGSIVARKVRHDTLHGIQITIEDLVLREGGHVNLTLRLKCVPEDPDVGIYAEVVE